MPGEDKTAQAGSLEDERTEPGGGRAVMSQGLILAAAGLLIVAAFWTTALDSLRILILWMLAGIILGRWGRQHVSDSQRAILAGLIGVGVVHLVIFPAYDQPPGVLIAKLIVLLAPLSALMRQISSGDSSAKPFAGWNRWVATAIAVSALLAITGAFDLWSGQNVFAAALVVLAPLAYILMFGRLVGDFRRPERRLAGRLMLGVPAIVALITTGQFLLIGLDKQMADRALANADPDAALRWNAAALDVNRRIEIRLAKGQLLLQRARILDALGLPAEALSALLERCRIRSTPPDDAPLRALESAYLSTSSLEPQIAAQSYPASLWRFNSLPIPENLSERSLLLGLFVRCGLLDRLLIEYTQGRLTDGLNFGYLLDCLDSFAAGRRDKPGAQKRPNLKVADTEEVWATYLSAVCSVRLGRRETAAGQFRRVLAQWPNYHNALVWLNRLGAASDSQRKPATTSAPVSLIENAQMVGSHRWGLNVDDALWTALEVLPGRYALEFEVNGLAAEGQFPILTVYLDGAQVLEEPVRTTKWTTVRWETQFDRDASHLLVVGFSNDILKKVDDREINRNLYLRRIILRRLP